MELEVWVTLFYSPLYFDIAYKPRILGPWIKVNYKCQKGDGKSKHQHFRNQWAGMGKFNSDDHYIYCCGRESLRRNGIALIVNKSLKYSTWVQSQKWQNDLCSYWGNITVIQVYAPTSNAEEAEVEQFYEDLQDLLELTYKKDILFVIGDWNAKIGSQEIPGLTGTFGLGLQNEAGQRLIEFCQENALVIANALSQKHKRRL